MRPDPRARLLAWLLPRLPGGTVAGASPDRIAAMQRRRLRDTPLSQLVIGRPLPDVEIARVEVAGGDGAVPARRYRPAGRPGATLPLILHLHTGGWVLRDLDLADWLLSRIARAVPATVVALDYRVAPQHPFPAALEDTVAALRWLGDHGHQLGGDPTRLAVMGESAGANLAAVAAHELRGGGPALACQVLLYPPTDLTGGVRTLDDEADPPILSREGQRTFRQLYLGDADPSDPRVSPLNANDHRGLPPALLQVGSHDPLRDDVRRYAWALRAAGVPVRGTIYLGAVHGFLSFPAIVPAARQAAWEVVNELRRHLTEPSPPPAGGGAP